MEQSTPRPKDYDGHPRIIYPAKLSAIMERTGKKSMTQTAFKIVYPTKQTQRKYRKQHFRLKSGISIQRDYTKNFIIIKT